MSSKKTASLLSRFFGADREHDIDRPILPQEEYNNKKGHTSMASKNHHQKKGKMSLRAVKPQTFTQESVFKSFLSGNNIIMHGIAGTGKTFIALYLTLKECERYQQYYKKVVIVRSAVPSRDMGYLPGNTKEKAAVYEAPYAQIVNKLYERGDAYEICKAHGTIEFITTSFLRGITFENCLVLVDEIQNMSYGELSTIITRMGDNCRVVFSGDFRQTDLFRNSEREGLDHFLNIIERMPQFTFHEFNSADIVRSNLVKSFIIEEADYRDRTPTFKY